MFHTVDLRRRSGDRLAGVGVLIGCGLLLVGLVTVGQSQPLIAIGAAIVVGVIVTLGFERAGVLFMVLTVFFAPMNNVRVVSGSASITASDILFFVATCLLLPTILTKPLRVPTMYAAGAAGLLFMGFVASAISETPVLSMLYMARLIMAGLIIPVVFMWWRPELRLLHVMAVAYICGNVISVCYALVDPVQRYRSYGLTTHVNNLGHVSLLSLALLPFVLSRLPRALRPAAALAALFCAYGVWASGSRAALLVAVLILMIYPVIEGSGKVAWLGAFAASLGVLFASKITNADQESALARLFGGSASSNSDRERSNALKLGWKQFNERPITGRGFVDVIDFHNIYLAMAVAVGILGLTAMLVLLWSTVQPVFFGSRPYGLISYAALAYVLFGALSTNLWDRFVWIILAMVLAARRLAEEEAPPGVEQAAAPQVTRAPLSWSRASSSPRAKPRTASR